MNNHNNRDEMLKDLQYIKEAVKKNNNILKYISISEAIKSVALISGVIIIGLSLLYLWIIDYYGDYQATPENVKLVTYFIIGLSFVGIGWYKIKAFLNLGRHYKKDLTLIMLLKEVYTGSLLTVMLPFFAAIIVITVFLSLYNLSHLIIPILAILFSLLMLAFIAILNIKNFLLFSGWLLLSGLSSLFIADKIHPLLILISTFGISMILLYLSALTSISKGKSD